MEQQFTEEEEKYLTKQVQYYNKKLIEQVMNTIAETEMMANADFAAQGIVFSEHSPSNADYLTVSVLEGLFHKLHGGDLEIAERILTMMARQTGIDTDCK